MNMELFFLPLLGIGILLALLVRGQRRQLRDDRVRRGEEQVQGEFTRLTTFQCPQCAEDIKIEAKICKHCGHDVSVLGKEIAAERAAKSAEHRSSLERDKQAAIRSVAITFTIVGAIFLAVGIASEAWPLIVLGVTLLSLGLFAFLGAQTAAKRARDGKV
jgi:hypothetical protein